MKSILAATFVILVASCSKPAGNDAPPQPSTGAAPASSASAACPMAQEIAGVWCQRRLEGCKESALSTQQCKEAFLKYTTIGSCKGTDSDKAACSTAIAALPCDAFKVTGSSVPPVCLAALR